MHLMWPSGDVQVITNIGPDDRLVLEGYFDSIAENFLELIYLNGAPTATVRTIKPLDADELKEVCFTIIFVRSSI